ncbi:MAG: hypothetical protein KAY24_18875 [Candidatus Eisenbacteria sp.]|nr:hypothetical protein [Candidatus Eisenbacteria bacterium]
MRLPFLGRWTCAIDGKRRLTLPAKIREILRMETEPHLVITVGHKGCLLVVPHARWDELAPELLRDTFQGDEEALRLRGTFARYGSLCQFDGSGRVTLTDEQMQVAGLERTAVVFGSFSRLEIWNPERFEIENPPIADQAEHDQRAARHMGGNGAQEVRE